LCELRDEGYCRENGIGKLDRAAVKSDPLLANSFRIDNGPMAKGGEMDGIRFDTMAKTLAVGASRRRTFGGLLVGALAAIGLSNPEDAYTAKSGKCKEDCLVCEKCKKGKCEVKDNDKRKCKPGKCKPRAVGFTCVSDSNVSGTCQSDRRCCRNISVGCTDACGPGAANVSCTACCSGICNNGLCT